MLIVKCVTMQKNEELLLEPWLRYHGHLFGFSNLIVIDNGSTLPSVVETLTTFEKVGVKVYRQFDDPADYARKGLITADVIRILDHQVDYDFAIPLDCDEFVALWQIDGVTCDRHSILEYLASLDEGQTHFRIENCIYNDPSRPGWFWPQGALKGLMRSRSIQSLDHGFHTFSEQKDFEMAQCDLTHLHFHHKPFEVLNEHARQKLKALVDVNDPKALRSYKGPGLHLVRNLLSDSAEYYRQFHDHLTFRFPDFSALMMALGVRNETMTMPNPDPLPTGQVAVRLPRDNALNRPKDEGKTVMLSPLTYRDLNFDLAAAGVNPLRHFLFIGYCEPRRIG